MSNKWTDTELELVQQTIDGELTYAEVAERTGRTEKAVSTKAYVLRKKLKETKTEIPEKVKAVIDEADAYTGSPDPSIEVTLEEQPLELSEEAADAIIGLATQDAEVRGVILDGDVIEPSFPWLPPAIATLVEAYRLSRCGFVTSPNAAHACDMVSGHKSRGQAHIYGSKVESFDPETIHQVAR